MSTMSEKILNDKIAELEELYAGVMPWYSGMYDPESGGIYATRSGKEDPELHPGLEMTGSALIKIKGYSGVWDRMPADVHERFVQFFMSRYDVSTGYFEEPYMKQLEQESYNRYRARIQMFSRNALKTLDAPAVPELKDESGEKKQPVLPHQFASVEKYVEWMEGLAWTTNSWQAGDRVQASQVYLRMLPAEQQGAYIDAMFRYLESIQDPVTGYWGVGENYNTMSGTFKVDLIYGTHGRSLPHTDKILESVFRTLRDGDAVTACYVRNAQDLLRTMATKHGCADVIRERLPLYLDSIIAAGKQLLADDGGFTSSRGKALSVYGGVQAGHGLKEGDVDATSMMLTARAALYPLLGMSAPSLSHTAKDFWERFC